MKLKDKNLYLVGGVVRDEILGLESYDTDYCYEGNAIEFANGLNIVRENPDFGTVKIQIDDCNIDIASTRIESYPQAGHLPIIEKIGCSLKDDLKRRDFTINAMAKNTLTGEIVDYYGGLTDIKYQKLRVLHEKSFIDDPSRIIRGLKFSIRFNFELDDYTMKLQKEYLKNINYDISYHRLKKELKEAFSLNKEEVYTKFIEQGLYKLLGEFCAKPSFVPSTARILNEEFKPIYLYMVYLGLFDLSNFELNREELDIVNAYNEIKTTLPKNDYDIYHLFNNKPIEAVIMYASTINYDVALKYLRNLKNIKIETCGEDLVKLGFKQGVIFKEIYSKLLKEKISNPKMNKIDEINFVRNFLK